MNIPLLFAAVIGFNHAFEADHVLAVGNLANRRRNTWHALRDGMYWGLGHTSMIFLVGCIIILGKTLIPDSYFSFFEVLVGITLIILGIYRIWKSRKETSESPDHQHGHGMAYSIGLIHGLAGSGAAILLAVSELQNAYQSILFLVLFGLGSVAGMILVAGLFNLPISRRIKAPANLQQIFVWASALLCMGYGAYMLIQYFS